MTTPTEIVKLTGYLRAHFPSQPVDEFTAEALGELLAPYPAADCRRAVLNIAERGDQWCPPTAVKAEVKRIRAKRIDEYGPIPLPPDMDPDDTARYVAHIQAARQAIGDGTMPPPAALTGPPRRDVVAELGHVGHTIEGEMA